MFYRPIKNLGEFKMRKLSLILIFTFFITTNFIYGKSSIKPEAENSSGNKYSELINKLPQGVSIYRLDNGIQVLLIEKPASPMVGINTVVKVGSAYETFATSGMSHMLEHLLFNGTNSMTQKQLYDAVDKIGGYNNANTSEYYTNFMMVTPADNIEAGMKIQADMLFHSTLPKKKFKKEKKIVLEEIAKTLANPDAQVQRNVNLILFKGQPTILNPYFDG